MRYEPWTSQQKMAAASTRTCTNIGSDWYGASANWAIPMLTEAIKQSRRDGAFHILMLNTDVEGHQVHPIPALSIDALMN